MISTLHFTAATVYNLLIYSIRVCHLCQAITPACISLRLPHLLQRDRLHGADEQGEQQEAQNDNHLINVSLPLCFRRQRLVASAQQSRQRASDL